MHIGCRGLSAFYGKVDTDEERFKVLDRAYELGELHWDSKTDLIYSMCSRQRLNLNQSSLFQAQTSTVTRKSSSGNGFVVQANVVKSFLLPNSLTKFSGVAAHNVSSIHPRSTARRPVRNLCRD
jgi:hypothetical protein